MCADGVRVAHPLFQGEREGSSPISALQLEIVGCPLKEAVKLNRVWHSRLPMITNATISGCFAFAAEFDGVRYAVAIWGNPVARLLNERGMLELRRMAVAPDAPKYTPSRMLAVMAKAIRKTMPEINTLISYQDTSVHKGTIYKAAGWTPREMKESTSTWEFPNRRRVDGPAAGVVKVRWELILRGDAVRPYVKRGAKGKIRATGPTLAGFEETDA